jgi:GT2 family glycosyltransferase
MTERKTTMSKAIGYVHDELVHARFMRCVLDAEKYEDALVLNVEGNNVPAQRNDLVRKFLNSDCEWLYMCDTDTVFAPNVISRLLTHATDTRRIISALVYCDGRPPHPMIYKRIADTGSGIGMFQAIAQWNPNELVRIDSAGAGCLLVHRDVYLEIEKRIPNKASTWFEYTNFSGMQMGEDFTFCMRAADAGFEIYADTSTRVGHIKPRVI